MNLQRAFLLLMFAIFLSVPQTLKAQTQDEPKNERLEKNRKQRKKDEKAAVRERTKRHESIQDKKTRKRMKKNRKRVDKEARRRHRRL